MKDKINQYKAKATVFFRKYANWSALSYIGKNPISKLIIFAPIVAQVLVQTPQHPFLSSFDFQWLHWAYWSVIFFALGQLIYTLICPSNIKEFPNEHNYIFTLDKTETNESLRVDAFENIRQSFVGYGGSLDITDENIEKLRDRLSLTDIESQQNHNNGTEITEQSIFENFVLLHEGLKKSGRVKGIDWVQIYNNLHILEKYMTETKPEISWADFYNLNYKIEKYALSKFWRVNLLNLRYKNENLSYPAWRAACIFLYMCGMTYFLYSGAANVIKIVATYLY